jgi:hypothetical protein
MKHYFCNRRSLIFQHVSYLARTDSISKQTNKVNNNCKTTVETTITVKYSTITICICNKHDRTTYRKQFCVIAIEKYVYTTIHLRTRFVRQKRTSFGAHIVPPLMFAVMY